MIKNYNLIFKSIFTALITFIGSYGHAQGNCANFIPISCGTPYTGTTVVGQSNNDFYGCLPNDEMG